MVFYAKQTTTCGSMQKIHQQLVLRAISSVYDESWCDAINPRVQKCCNQSCERCYGYPVGGYRSVLLNGLSNATHLELIADPNVVCVQILPSDLIVV
jgi:hypothetical protein